MKRKKKESEQDMLWNSKCRIDTCRVTGLERLSSEVKSIAQLQGQKKPQVEPFPLVITKEAGKKTTPNNAKKQQLRQSLKLTECTSLVHEGKKESFSSNEELGWRSNLGH